MPFDDLFAAQKVMGILRGHSAAETAALATRAWDLGLAVVEVTVETPHAMPALAAAIRAGRERGMPVGAGTVYTPEQVAAVAQAGAAFTVAPGFDEQIAMLSQTLGMPHLPGVATPSELQRALRSGHTWVKAFPASVLGPAWFRAVRGPFPDVRIVATGGIDAGNAGAFRDAGADVVAVGSALAHDDQMQRLAELFA